MDIFSMVVGCCEFVGVILAVVTFGLLLKDRWNHVPIPVIVVNANNDDANNDDAVNGQNVDDNLNVEDPTEDASLIIKTES